MGEQQPTLPIIQQVTSRAVGLKNPQQLNVMRVFKQRALLQSTSFNEAFRGKQTERSNRL